MLTRSTGALALSMFALSSLAACGSSGTDDGGLDGATTMDAGRDATAARDLGRDATVVDADIDATSSTDLGADSPASDGCSPMMTAASAVPVDVYVMLSQAGSMSATVSGGGTKWSEVTAGLSTFAAAPGLSSMSMGVQYFGLPGSSGDSCTASDYAMPDVEIAVLPGAHTAIDASLALHSPSTATATSAALQGAVDHAAVWETAHAGHVVAAVLITSAEPSECDTTLTDIDAIAAAALTGASHAQTFVITVTTGLTSPDGIAAAGGTGAALVADPAGAGLAMRVTSALDSVRDTLGCSYVAPATTILAVERTPAGGSATTIPPVTNLGACPATGDGWYRDAATHVVLCPATCRTTTTDHDRIDLVVGC